MRREKKEKNLFVRDVKTIILSSLFLFFLRFLFVRFGFVLVIELI